MNNARIIDISCKPFTARRASVCIWAASCTSESIQATATLEQQVHAAYREEYRHMFMHSAKGHVRECVLEAVGHIKAVEHHENVLNEKHG
jgi:hypothetical protein